MIASGQKCIWGRAAELYKWAVKRGMWISGVKMMDALFAEHYLKRFGHFRGDFQNSKYVYSDTKYVFKQIAEKLKNNERVALFVGLPCQCDALKAVCNIKRISTNKLYVVDLYLSWYGTADLSERTCVCN